MNKLIVFVVVSVISVSGFAQGDLDYKPKCTGGRVEMSCAGVENARRAFFCNRNANLSATDVNTECQKAPTEAEKQGSTQNTKRELDKKSR